MNIERGDILYNSETKDALLIGEFTINSSKITYSYKEIGSEYTYFINKVTENFNVFDNYIRLGNVNDIDMDIKDILNKKFEGDKTYNKYKFIKDIKFNFLKKL